MGLFERQIAVGLALAASSAGAASFNDGHLQLGECALAADPVDAEGIDAIGVSACGRGNAGAETSFVSGAPKENTWLRYAAGTLGVYYGQYFSLQGQAHLRDTLPMSSEGRKNLDRETDVAVVQVGNPALHRLWLQAGHLALPFGLDQSFANESYQSLENSALWSSPPNGAALSLDNKIDTRLDVGYAETDRSAAHKTAVSARLSYDISALDGSRIMLSGYGENHGVRRMGAAFLTVSRKGDTTAFEFVRRVAEPVGGKVPFQQVLRLIYGGAFRNDARWVVQFDDERFRFRMGTVGQDFLFWDHAALRIAGAYQKSESGDGKRRWILTTGLEAQL